MKWLEVDFQGRKTRVPALKFQGRLWFHWLGVNHVVDAGGTGRRAASEKAATHPGIISAPMPGKITRVVAAMGATVAKGQTLVVMEAMKMEYSLSADLDGKVQELNAQVGAQVGLGEVLVRLVAT